MTQRWWSLLLLLALLPPTARAATPPAQPAPPVQADWHYRIRPGEDLAFLDAIARMKAPRRRAIKPVLPHHP